MSTTKGSRTHLYEILEVEQTATEQEIKKAYRKLAMVSEIWLCLCAP
jgi:preprotein translocase subunit Sec63